MERGMAMGGGGWPGGGGGGGDGAGGAADPTATSGVADTNGQTTASAFRIGIYGWRKRCLYCLLLVLLVMVIVNLALTLWVLKVMQFSSDGMGELRIIPGGLQLSGDAMILDTLIASKIRSRKGQPILIESSRNLTFHARDSRGKISNRLALGDDRLECLTKGISITDPKGQVLFSADKKEVRVGADVLRVSGQGGAVFDGSIQTPLVKADYGNELRLESPTRSLKVTAPLGIDIESKAGDISAICLNDLKMQSMAGSILLDSQNIFLPSLKTAEVSRHPDSSMVHRNVFQLCVCSNGKLFLAQPHKVCEADSSICR